MQNLSTLPAYQIAELVQTAEVSAVEVAQAALDRIRAVEPSVHAFLELTSTQALEAARATDQKIARGEDAGRLAGVPLGIKDNMNLVGTHTTCASKMLESYVSPYTASCVQRLLDEGATPLGKLNMDEFAFGSSTETSFFGRTNNPWDTGRVPGGSSGGSAAAVAAAEVPLALGSDTGGSIRQPASLCGIVGLKPSYGAVSRFGVVAFGSSLDQVGPMTRNVRDCALAMDALVAAGSDPRDCTSHSLEANFVASLDRGLEGLRIGVVRSLQDAKGLSSEAKQIFMLAEQQLKDAGAELVDIELPNLGASIAAYYAIGPCEAFSNLARFDSVRYGYQEPGCETLTEQCARSRAVGFGSEAKRRQLLGAYLLSSGMYKSYYLAAQKVRTLITQDYEQAFTKCDAVIMPTVPGVAWEFGAISDPTEMYLSDMFTIGCNIAGNCALHLPCGLGSESGLPLGVQLVGSTFADAKLLGIAAALEASLANSGIQAKDCIAPVLDGE